ncbi:hypothetical protein B2J93_7164 [Marssonina coronariae]|uniref:Uncharacterized protein n=1 Tax=Diplocarpon coronariae TaxID=2795749 RepID=A0A218Z561_9HELO|nr:hypothetical protein B2J93_7164 [Marssonina coronariae]
MSSGGRREDGGGWRRLEGMEEMEEMEEMEGGWRDGYGWGGRLEGWRGPGPPGLARHRSIKPSSLFIWPINSSLFTWPINSPLFIWQINIQGRESWEHSAHPGAQASSPTLRILCSLCSPFSPFSPVPPVSPVSPTRSARPQELPRPRSAGGGAQDPRSTGCTTPFFLRSLLFCFEDLILCRRPRKYHAQRLVWRCNPTENLPRCGTRANGGVRLAGGEEGRDPQCLSHPVSGPGKPTSRNTNGGVVVGRTSSSGKHARTLPTHTNQPPLGKRCWRGVCLACGGVLFRFEACPAKA